MPQGSVDMLLMSLILRYHDTIDWAGGCLLFILQHGSAANALPYKYTMEHGQAGET